jgi:hypothetical protein
MAANPAVRYSQNKRDIGEAKNFSWEYPVPDNKFWRDLDYVVGRNFLQCFSADEIKLLPFDDSPSKSDRLELLLRLLREKLSSEDAAAAPQTVYDVNYDAWEKLLLAIYTIQMQQDRHADTEQTIRTLVERRKDKSNLSHFHSLSGLLCNQGRYTEAEETEISVKRWLDEYLGKDSPQALGSRRIIAQSVWKQGPSRRAEAKELFSEVIELINGMDGGNYAVYQAQEMEVTEKLIMDLENWSTPVQSFS